MYYLHPVSYSDLVSRHVAFLLLVFLVLFGLALLVNELFHLSSHSFNHLVRLFGSAAFLLSFAANTALVDEALAQVRDILVFFTDHKFQIVLAPLYLPLWHSPLALLILLLNEFIAAGTVINPLHVKMNLGQARVEAQTKIAGITGLAWARDYNIFLVFLNLDAYGNLV